eukprot:CAMPEP_0185036140 /NCGR_PEP_ID=MMETSP1103-20130426/28660_1 /TAXON_ID=36769 /ORGANISM="Paraphysomonas bandaiensis, Strain Caron Lab Isolate" /LENGTH=794 /DNA_ID=CAMNT_0027573553 /DNA_START=160 /DNA_END=2544 /DNA_ORIENTATION=-
MEGAVNYICGDSTEKRYKSLSVALAAALVLMMISNPCKRGQRCQIEEIEDNQSSLLLTVLLRVLFVGGFGLLSLKTCALWTNELRIYREIKKSKEFIEEFNLSEYFFSRLDYLYSHNEKFKPVALLTATLFLILVGGVLWWFVTDYTLFESFWFVWTFVADPGTHADNSDTLQRIVSLMMTLGGMIIFAMAIGMITEDISSYVDNLRKGRSRVIVSKHTLILGQGDMLIPIIQQLALANESAGGGAIVILTQCPKHELEETIHAAELNLRGSDVIVRTGVPHLQSDLRKASAMTARSVVVLADKNSCTTPDMTDINTVRTVLSLRGMGAPVDGHIVAEVLDVDNENLVKIVGKESLETFVSHDVIGRLMIQCARERGLAQVLEQLLGFEGCEFYIKEWPEMTGRTFGEVMYMFSDAIVVGLIRQGVTRGATETLLNPHVNEVVREGDRIVVIAEDDDTYTPVQEPLFMEDWEGELDKLRIPYKSRVRRPERMLFVGWRRDIEDMISELDSYVCKGSELTLFNQLDLHSRQERLAKGGRKNVQENLRLTHTCGNPTYRQHLEALPLEEYDFILILADEDFEGDVSYDMMYADTRSLTTLLLIRDIQQKRNVNTRVKGRLSIFDDNFATVRSSSPLMEDTRRATCSTKQVEDEVESDEEDEFSEGRTAAVISEILDVRTKPLISVASVTDYVTSNELLSMVIAMVSEQREVNHILKELLSSDGNEIYLVPVSTYLKKQTEASFYELMALAKSVNHLTVGYKIRENVVINPADKRKRIKWPSNTHLIILALGLDTND